MTTPHGYLRIGTESALRQFDVTLFAGDNSPKATYHKEVIKVGNYVHPGTGKPFEVTPAKMDGWVAAFKRMTETGTKVPLVNDHIESVEAQRGWVTGLWVEGGSLMASYDVIGEDAIRDAERNDVSICYGELDDANGNRFPDAVLHVALTPIPAIPGLSKAIKVAASRDAGDGVNVPVMTLATEVSAMDEFKTQLVALLGLEIAEDASAEDVDAAIIAAVEALTKTEEAEDVVEEAVAAEPAVAPATEELSRGRAIDATMLSLMADTTDARLENLLMAGQINKPVKDKLSKALGSVNRVALSAAKASDNAQKCSSEVLEALKGLPAIKTGEKTNGQRLALSREGDEPSAAEQAKARLARMNIKGATA